MARSNLAYRRPALYDAMTADDEVAGQVAKAVGECGVRPLAVLDLGCGTGRHLAALRDELGAVAVGVDLQTGMLDYGRRRYGVDLRRGDLRSIRLGRRFELVTCLGNSLSYLHADDDLVSAVQTMRAHVEDRGVVVISTLTNPLVEPAEQVVRVETACISADVEIASAWDAERRLQVTRRTWRHDDGRIDVDVLRRRVVRLDELVGLLHGAGFVGGRLVGAGYVVATVSARG
ncbi:class I SAM-dependent methyltransferase [Kribbella sp. NPDC056951]|uniref:class I SAM-dependent methyltransferase n=1 Tax=Kribbella sp. NPDC056951 TaxID=3345978 RepID=UPI0036426855